MMKIMAALAFMVYQEHRGSLRECSEPEHFGQVVFGLVLPRKRQNFRMCIYCNNKWRHRLCIGKYSRHDSTKPQQHIHPDDYFSCLLMKQGYDHAVAERPQVDFHVSACQEPAPWMLVFGISVMLQSLDTTSRTAELVIRNP